MFSPRSALIVAGLLFVAVGVLQAGGYFLDPNRIPLNSESAWMSRGRQIRGRDALYSWPVWACVRIIADTVSTLPIDLIVGGQAAEQLPSKLANPAAGVTWSQWAYQVMVSLLLDGNAYGLVASRDRLGYPSQVELLDPQSVLVARGESGGRQYTIQGRRVPADQIWHFAGPAFPGDLVGLSPIRYAARTVSLGLDAEQMGGDYFANGFHPSGVVTSDQALTEELATTIKRRIKLAQSQRDVVVLGNGFEAKPWQITPEESQFLETIRSNAVAISQVFGVPPEMIGSAARGASITYANREQRAQDFLQNAVNPWLARFEEQMSGWFPRGQSVMFNTGGLLRSDMASRYAAYAVATAGKPWLLPSEVRDLENLPDVDGIDTGPDAGLVDGMDE
jgi:HK97 family phage portal protein